jgi:hypothetical protein
MNVEKQVRRFEKHLFPDSIDLICDVSVQKELMETMCKNNSRQFAHLNIEKLKSWGIKVEQSPKIVKKNKRNTSSKFFN